ncbi:hypothetical protein [Arthrobacter sp. AQ5-05]|uniref:hypothetical protein n=1 Tax=Arthrobacter sp. AQ5-05 TaxID=2184581 RepID=UPI0015EC706A|nr:hypothetical protein [Arthrobacter sp. AQ5-05]
MSTPPLLEMVSGQADPARDAAPPPEAPGQTPVWTIDNERAELTLVGSELLEAKFHPGTVLTLETARELWGLADAHLERKIKYLIVDLCGLDGVKADATAMLDPMTDGIRVALLGTGPADRVLARFFMRSFNPARQFTYVESRQDALAFLFELV